MSGSPGSRVTGPDRRRRAAAREEQVVPVDGQVRRGDRREASRRGIGRDHVRSSLKAPLPGEVAVSTPIRAIQPRARSARNGPPRPSAGDWRTSARPRRRDFPAAEQRRAEREPEQPERLVLCLLARRCPCLLRHRPAGGEARRAAPPAQHGQPQLDDEPVRYPVIEPAAARPRYASAEAGSPRHSRAMLSAAATAGSARRSAGNSPRAVSNSPIRSGSTPASPASVSASDACSQSPASAQQRTASMRRRRAGQRAAPANRPGPPPACPRAARRAAPAAGTDDTGTCPARRGTRSCPSC